MSNLKQQDTNGSSRFLQAAAYALALALLAASIWYAIGDQRTEDWRALLDAEPGILIALIATVIVSAVLIPGLQFWLVTRPFVSTKPLNFSVMQALLAASSLLNYTPIKAGLIGRVGYLRQYHGVGLRAAVLSHMIIGVVFVAAAAVILLATAWRGNLDAGWWAILAVGLAVSALLGAPVLRAAIPRSTPVDARMRDSVGWAGRYLMICLLAQVAALFAAALRWWLVFRILEHPISLADAWLAAIVHMLSVMLGPANGLGLREWLIGIGGQQGWLSDALGSDIGVGLTAALVDRAAEAVVLIVCGLLGLWFLRRANRIQSAEQSG
jgi:hypothetical protein